MIEFKWFMSSSKGRNYSGELKFDSEQWIIMVNFPKNQKVNTVFIHLKLGVIENSIYFEKLKGYVLVAVIQ